MPARVQTHCVYVLRSLSSPARSYVGYTSDPAHRLRQHNGEVAGGAPNGIAHGQHIHAVNDLRVHGVVGKTRSAARQH